MGGKRTVKRLLGVGISLLCAAALVGCGGGMKSESTADSAFYSTTEAPAMAMEEAYDMESSANASEMDVGGISDMELKSEAGGAVDEMLKKGQKLVKTVSIGMETKEFDTLLPALTAEVNRLEGYIESSEVSGNSYYGNGSRNAWLTIRVPAARLDEFLSAVGEMGNVTNRSENVQDITLNYVDVESHKKALQTEQERLLALMEKAENMEDIIQIETRLSEIRYELQSYESRLRTMDNQVDYSTVNINIYEVERITPVEDKSFLEEVGYRLENNFRDIRSDLREFGIWFLSSLPYILIWAAVIFIIVKVVRHVLRKRKERREERQKIAEEKSKE